MKFEDFDFKFTALLRTSVAANLFLMLVSAVFGLFGAAGGYLGILPYEFALEAVFIGGGFLIFYTFIFLILLLILRTQPNPDILSELL